MRGRQRPINKEETPGQGLESIEPVASRGTSETGASEAGRIQSVRASRPGGASAELRPPLFLFRTPSGRAPAVVLPEARRVGASAPILD